MKPRAFIDSLRQAGPYINAHRGRTFVIGFGGEALEDPAVDELVQDIGLLRSLGARLVLVHGARPQIEQRLAQAGLELRYAGGLRITDADALPLVKEAVGRSRIRLEARLSMGLAQSPLQGARLRVVSGNFVTARPLGVREGVDYCFTGEVRRIDAAGIRGWLDQDALVLLSPLGYSPTGEVFNLSAEEIATAAAAALRADKLLLLYEGDDLRTVGGELLRELDPAEAERLLAGADGLADDVRRHLEQALRACRAGVRRVHLLRRTQPGALLLELYSRDGVGSMLSADSYDTLRGAGIDDVGGILALIRPLEEAGILVRRSRERLEVEIERVRVLERDGAIIGCAALYPFPQERFGELACLAVADDYRNGGRADSLLRQIEQQARRQGLDRLFVLTTRTAHWFQERGFAPAGLDDLPVARKALYNWQRASKVFVKTL
ncbi:MAG: amino-acid N-acetyltransferase [Candidatus Competibacterales bacterium]|nr:amino-acid N-acetyltransferase [Candidatus Competibacterales bacterium]